MPLLRLITKHARFGLGILLALATVPVASVQIAEAAAHSTNVAYVFDFGTGYTDTCGPSCGSSIFVNAVDGVVPSGGTYTTPSGTVTHFTNVTVSSIDSGGVGAISSFDTVMLYQVCDIGSHPNLLTALNTYLSNGLGKVVIYDGDRCAPGEGGTPDYSKFLFPFTSTNPGPQGAAGTVTQVEAETPPAVLTRGVSTGLVDTTDAVGDSNTFNSNTGGWCAAEEGTNVLGTNGIQVGYARTATGGLAIYDGNDNWFTDGPNAWDKTFFDNILDQPFNPDSLPCGVPVTGIKLSPLTATNPVGGSHTVTATVTDSTGKAVPGVTVTFTVQSGPNAGQGGVRITDPSGNASFTYTDSGGAGTDTIVATFKDSTGAVHSSGTVMKIWQPTVSGDTIPPTCALTGVVAGPPKQILITVQDTGSGLGSVVVTENSNVSVAIPPFAIGSTAPLIVTATKVNQSAGSSVALRVTDVAGNVTNCDPALLSVGTDPGTPSSQTVHHVSKGESTVTIYNGTPGLTRLELVVDGKRQEITGLTDGATRTVDVSSLLHKGSNTVTVVAQGKAGGSATVILTN
jgi:hypothetical protein